MSYFLSVMRWATLYVLNDVVTHTLIALIVSKEELVFNSYFGFLQQRIILLELSELDFVFSCCKAKDL